MSTDSRLPAATFTARELLDATGGRWLPAESAGGGAPSDDSFRTTGVATDSRADQPGALFVALSGDRFDAHTFAADAVARGAAALLVSRPVSAPVPRLLVPDTLAALQALARHHRVRFDIPLVGLTGSNGKTTTREMIAAVLSPLGPVHRTAGNLNNHIGVPLTLLGLDPAHRAAVVEMGMNHEGEIRLLAGIARPTVAVITNAGRAHLEGLGSLEAVVRAKSEIAERLTGSETLVLFGDDPLLADTNRARPCRKVTFGFGPSSGVTAANIVEMGLAGSEFDVDGFGRIRLVIPGRHNILNALAALAVARVLGVDAERAVAALGRVAPFAGRMEVKRFGRLTVIDDSYNANPDSMRAALDLLRHTEGAGRRVAVLGEMLELGRASQALHREIGAAAAFVDRLFLIGPSAQEAADAAREAGAAPGAVVVAASIEELLPAVTSFTADGDLVLVKGSRGMALERVVKAIEAASSHPAGGGR